MAEGFKVEPGAVAGYGLLVVNVYEQVAKENNYIRDHGASKNGFDGLILNALKGPVDAYAQATTQRIGSTHSWHLINTSEELKRTAWVYTDKDEFEYTEYGPQEEDKNGKLGKPTVAGYKPFPNPMAFPVSSDPTGGLTPPEIPAADIKSKVDEVGGSLKAIDWIVRQVTGWSPVEAITNPIAGNWNALKASGDALIKAGDALEESLSNLTKALPQLDAKWDGGAAQSFTTYLNGVVTGAGQEGPLNRLVGGVYGMVSKEIEKVAELVVAKLKGIVDQILSRLATGWIPFVGWARLIDFIRECVVVFNEVKAAVDRVIAIKDQAIQLIEIAKDPIGALKEGAQNKIEEKLKPIEEKMDQYQRGAKVAADLLEVAKVNEWNATPTGGYYKSGDDPRRVGG